ncbi:unnamed protein product [Pedinophyceae sp. YPF-701]|nr:unnamed protein product [Pedinophyceae sp. YPF-701]
MASAAGESPLPTLTECIVVGGVLFLATRGLWWLYGRVSGGHGGDGSWSGRPHRLGGAGARDGAQGRGAGGAAGRDDDADRRIRILRGSYARESSALRRLPRKVTAALRTLARGFFRASHAVSCNGAVGSLVALNVVVFLMWQSAGKGRTPWGPYDRHSGLQIDRADMHRHFTVSVRNQESGRWWSLVGAAFSHQERFHLLANMASLVTVARSVDAEVGSGALLAAYLVCGVVGNQAWLAWERGSRLGANSGGGVVGDMWRAFDLPGDAPGFLKRWFGPSIASLRYALGASGAVEGLLAMLTVLRPLAPLSLSVSGVPTPPMPAVVGTLLHLLFEVSYMVDEPGSGVGHSAHVGGGVLGLALGLLLRGAKGVAGA